MSGFDLANNYTDNPEALLRKNRSHTTSSTTPPTVEPVTPVPSTTLHMAKSLHDYSTPAIANVPVGPAVNTGTGNLSFELASLRWYRQTNFVVCQARTQVLTCNISWSSAIPSSSKMSHQLSSGFICFPSPLQGRRNSGSIKKRKLSVRGTNVPWCSS
jgi:hypothetical protein